MRRGRAGVKQNGLTMMTLDDDANITAALKDYFEAAGFAVDAENDPERALERLAEKKYDILLLDFLMSPLCGDEVVTRLRKFDRDVFVIMLTGHRDIAPPLNTIRELDIQAYYEKSTRFDQLELLVESCVKSIRQLRIIRKYRDGMAGILSAAPDIHRLQSLDMLVDNVLSKLAHLAQKKDGFMIVDRDSNREKRSFDAWIAEPERLALGGRGMYGAPFELYLSKGPEAFLEALRHAYETGRPKALGTVMIAPLTDSEGAVFGLIGTALEEGDDSRGIFDLYVEQVSSALLNARLHHAVSDRNEKLTAAYHQLNESYLQTISLLRLVVDAKDFYTRGHSDRVAFYGKLLAQRISDDTEFIERVSTAGLFHDVGKMSMPDRILTKPGPLDAAEMDEMRRHPRRGAKLLSSITMFNHLGHIVQAHHERWDGTGYPFGLKGEAIPIEARIIAIADAYDTMTSDRHYRKKLTFPQVIEQLETGRGTQFDPTLAGLFLEIVRDDHQRLTNMLEWTYNIVKDFDD